MKTLFLRVIIGIYLTPMLTAVSLAASLLSPNDFILSVDPDPLESLSRYPLQESPGEAGDGIAGTKYLNFAETNTGLIVTPFLGSTTIRLRPFKAWFLLPQMTQ